MAFTESQILSISDITGLSVVDTKSWITYQGANITSAIETAIASEITAWNSVKDNTIEIKPMESNRGAEVSNSGKRSAITERVRRWLNIPDSAGGGHGSYFMAERG